MRDAASRSGAPISATPQAPARSRMAVRLAALCISALALMTLPAATSFASEHLVVTGEYGKEGPAATGLGDGCRIAYHAPNLYFNADEKIYGLYISPGSVSPLSAGSATPLSGFPVTTGLRSTCGDPDFEVSPLGDIFAAPDSQSIYGWNVTGAPIGLPWPVNAGGEACGLAVNASGEVWTSNFGQQIVRKFTSAGEPNGTIPVGFPFCKFTVDPSTNDLYAVKYFGEGEHAEEEVGRIYKFTAASGYATRTLFASPGDRNPGLVINGADDKLYVTTNSNGVEAYNTNTAALVETVNLEGAGGDDVAVDEGTDTLFVSIGFGATGKILEYAGDQTPRATTGDPTGNPSEVSGTADPNGQGDITECFFEFGLTIAYGMTQPCFESLPISSAQTVHAQLPHLLGEETYHYRLVVGNGNPRRTGRGGDKTIIGHNVVDLLTEPATEITKESAVLNASFEGTNEDTHYYFEYGRTTHYGHTTAAPPGDDAGTTTGPTEVSTELSGLRPGSQYHFRVVAENSIGIRNGQDETFTTFEPPSITSAKTSGLTATSAVVEATINPNGFETEYEVEYGPTAARGSTAPIPVGHLSAGNSIEPVSVLLEGLEPVVYHFRVIARNVWGETTTGDQTFTFFPPSCPNADIRQKTGASYLPDCRAYELVSPGIAGNIRLIAASQPAPYAQSPSRFLYVGVDGVLEGTSGVNGLTADTYVATRTTSGWISKYTGIHSTETVLALFGMGNRNLDTFLNFKNGCCGQVPYIFDAEEKFLGRWPADWADFPGADKATGSFQPSPDFSHMAFSSQTNFDPSGQGVTGAPGSAYVYDATTGTTELISKTAAGDDIPQDAVNGDPNEVIEFPGSREPGFEGTPAAMYPSVSTDGSHILMSTKVCQLCALEHLYMRVTSDHLTYDIAGGQPVDYYGITSDGTKVFFTSDKQLTSDDHDTSVDLYMWSEQGALSGEPLTLISKGTGANGNTDACTASWTTKCGVVTVEGVAETDYPIATDTGDVYFYSPELLDAAEGGTEGSLNLYVYRRGAIRFVTTLSSDGSGQASRFQVSPDGSHAAFVTNARLTSYDNAGKDEMFSYDPESGAVECVSCIPSGEPPSSNVKASVSGFFMSADGRTFFSTSDALVAKDTNEGSDVYEFVDGRPQLISTGTGQVYHETSGEAVSISLMGVSPNGIDVYFSTFDTLVRQDRNGAAQKFYDARTGGGFDVTPESPPCEAADECHGAGTVPPAPAVITSNEGLGAGGNANEPKRPKHRSKRHKHRHKKKPHRGNSGSQRGARHD